MENENDKDIEELEELLKGIKASIKAPTLPSIGSIGNKTLAPIKNTVKLPSVAPKSTKNPIKQAEQLKNKDIKDMEMRQVREKLSINKATGQWKLDEEPFGKPFASQAQRRWMHSAASRGEVPKDMPKKWEEHTPDKKLPEHVGKADQPSAVKSPPKDNLLRYHIHDQGIRVTSEPLTLDEINRKHGGVKKLEGAGYRLHQVKEGQ
jgi:hypothetical protein